MEKKKFSKVRRHTRYDNLPCEIQQLIDTRLADPSLTYQTIADEVTNLGYKISRSSIGRLALAKNKNTKALEIRLAIAREQAKVAADMAKNGNATDYAEGILNIVATEMANRLLSASTEEFDSMSMQDVLKSVSRLARDLSTLGRLKYTKDKGTSTIYAELEEVIDKYIDDNPELKQQLLSKVSEELEKKK